MPHPNRTNCVVCGAHRDDVGPISWTGKCRECGPKVAAEWIRQIHDGTGPYYDVWLRGKARAAGFELVRPATSDRARQTKR